MAFSDFVEVKQKMEYKPKEKKDLIKGGTHIARCYGVVDVGTQKGNPAYPDKKTGKAKDERKVFLFFELPNLMKTFSEEKGPQPMVTNKKYTWSFYIDKDNNPKSNLAKDLLSWFSDKQPDGDMAHWVDSCVIGRTAMLTISQKQYDDGSWGNKIDSISPIPDGMSCAPAINPIAKFDMFGSEFDVPSFDKLHKWQQDMITMSPEFAKLSGKKELPPQVGFDDVSDLPF